MVLPKRRRITHACDFCHRRGLKCKSHLSQQTDAQEGHQAPSSCLTCIEYGQQCTRTRRPKKRGTKSHFPNQQPYPSLTASIQNRHAGSAQMHNRRTITALLDVYLDSIHPTFPLFCERELWVGWREGTFPNDDSDYMSLVCMCALSTQHIQKRALFTDDTDVSVSETLGQDYLAEAIKRVPVGFEHIDLNLIRSYAFLALLGSQTGNNAMLHQYLALYHGACAQFNLLGESQWPIGLSQCEREVRRRLCWAMYRLEVHTACVLGNVVRMSEEQTYVGYPVGTHHPSFIPGRDGQFEDWFTGWNQTTDLYRVLEHVLFEFRRSHRPSQSILGFRSGAHSEALMQRLGQLQAKLLPQFAIASSKSGDSGRNRCGFQACNILCTIYLARLLSCISSKVGIQVTCNTALEMVETMRAIPLDYVRAIGSPLVQQLAGMGHIIITATNKQSQTQADRLAAHDAVLAIITLLDSFRQPDEIPSSNQLRLAARVAEIEQSTGASASDAQHATNSFNKTPHAHVQEMGQELWSEMFPTNLLVNFAWIDPGPE
ncbi:hypothetical protein DM02DRAFT_650064 [Periconia macrospinosa]|uniref:Zn(2)-C6 fungal-type domain-containing protein n=1 Tax=Periconia macrospinosa TaxID=97972 RepID=A0A2V1E6I3_9PLEO|nr:hypothetical protein DM02DRAFT_650064 [Periconia macrospinosa]